MAEMSPYFTDPEALAWARGVVERVREKYREFERQAQSKGDIEQASQWRKFANLLDMEFIGGKGCVVAPFDERRPAFVAALESAPTATEEQTGGGNG